MHIVLLSLNDQSYPLMFASSISWKQQSNALAAALSNPELLEKSYQETMDSAGSAANEEKNINKAYSIQLIIQRQN